MPNAREPRESELAMQTARDRVNALDKLVWYGDVDADDIEWEANQAIEKIEEVVRLWKEERGLKMDPPKRVKP
jgi:hypothetical protein